MYVDAMEDVAVFRVCRCSAVLHFDSALPFPPTTDYRSVVNMRRRCPSPSPITHHRRHTDHTACPRRAKSVPWRSTNPPSTGARQGLHDTLPQPGPTSSQIRRPSTKPERACGVRASVRASFPPPSLWRGTSGTRCGPLHPPLGACLKPEIANRRQASVSRPEQTRPNPDQNGGPPTCAPPRRPLTRPPNHTHHTRSRSRQKEKHRPSSSSPRRRRGRRSRRFGFTSNRTNNLLHSRSLHSLPSNQHTQTPKTILPSIIPAKSSPSAVPQK